MIHGSVRLTFSILLGLATHVGAADGYCQKPFGTKACWPNCVGKYTCDDYVPKCEPCPKPVKCFTCDDYCRICPPLAKPSCCFTCDDYCRKPFRLCCPPLLHLAEPRTQQVTQPRR
jgi:hypothetical protein